ncbi:glycosyltransferase [Xylanibacillus composti]|uniref:N-acetylglucosaminyldiphosphoundecaprenol N-acetyl-beta-D-mannosaminyltransferase n=1 Tax=Xylanibacillus composti TaxID=1572762 RepID=A0A8J4H6X6_9BACL|nr:WecB/TagA/CpsF family glycosyltransferase [Xylanibacillus composti]MDT9725961.1 glycosyltransferase [Xylanibacillus composti]GIQ70885.1 N-acetylmannosaminyltransferase [Xylanibacillus composti]
MNQLPLSYPKMKLFDITVSTMNMQETVEYLTEAVRARTPHQVITANPIMMMAALEDPAYKAMMQQAELIVPDGTGVVWAASRLGSPVKERVAGYDLLHELLRKGEPHGWKVYLLGAEPDVVHTAAARIREMYPGIQLVGERDGYFKDEEDAEVIADIREKQPDLLFVARSAKNQEPWIGKYKNELQVPVMMGVGGSFDVIAGKVKRAPDLWIRLRLEWLYRLVKEPWRWRRMLALPKFMWRVIRTRP